MSEEKATWDVTPRTWEQAADYWWNHIAKPVMVARHKKYGPQNILAYGELGLEVRASDKLARIRHHREGSEDFTEDPVGDSWLDLANYTGPIRWMLVNGYWELPMEGQPSYPQDTEYPAVHMMSMEEAVSSGFITVTDEEKDFEPKSLYRGDLEQIQKNKAVGCTCPVPYPADEADGNRHDNDCILYRNYKPSWARQ